MSADSSHLFIPMVKRKRVFTLKPRRRRFARNKRRVKRRRRMQPLAGQPRCKYLRLRYCTNVSLDPSIGLVAGHSFRPDSIFDPDSTGTGHQPMGHDEWADFYSRYIVLGAKTTATFLSDSASATSGNCIVGIHEDHDTSTPLGADHMRETGGSKWKYLLDSDQKGKVTVVQKYSAKRFHCLKDIKDAVQLESDFGASPGYPVYHTLFVAPLYPTQDVSIVRIIVTIDFMVMLKAPKDLSQS
jgi:hypothetical protein